jgi:hypothetical protein
MREGVAGLLRDKTRKLGPPPLPVVDRAVTLTFTEPPSESTHWTGRPMVAATDISLRSVQRIWASHGLQPHLVRRFKLSQDPAFAAKRAMWSSCISTRRRTAWCCRSMRGRRSRRSTAPSRVSR